jgi:acyl-CoA thioester hydrolase
MPAPIHCLDVAVPSEWLDYNGHMNDACYAIAFSRAVDAFLDQVEFSAVVRGRTGRTMYTLSMLIRFVAEAKLGDNIAVNLHLLERDSKRIRIWQEARRPDDTLLATCEQVLMCVDQSGPKPRAAEFPVETGDRLIAIADEHEALPAPREAGQGLLLRRREPFSVTP